ncbi:2-succinyl-6-hydroxy-2,4-cyclohexadiene-1-carboxylate synthase [Oikeobacillus pervagus]|uniref:Putative 2-succinyl-6-hydroxy-2,4-cyclohexadiene-1-carboxylate synthase n=1 Tax=Oikeobacillus pervagus TaxID=1325931 RepID=A0AAJ1T637_9BACI|nr:2-succinyl-6-hydroxy-2,4-cyclohexadiene-1-carboxylate synthase [Oikeobacillus pervagus]MDQ0216564.1 2-succinyl-6-hydroxy-2,4-cyclohexadiene-1-carboxylate synthase [Oikeobacillus pervagus]
MIVHVNDCSFFVEIKGEGEPLLLLHGFTGESSTWDKLMEQLSPRFQCIAVDIVGHGKSAKPDNINDYKIERVAENITFILNELNINQTHVLGYSMGGRLALTMAILFPEKVKSLILESASPGIKTEEERRKRRESDHLLANRIIQLGIERFVNDWENIPLFSTQKRLPIHIQQSIRKQRLSQSPLGLANSLRGMGTGEQPSFWGDLHNVEIPVLLVTGAVDEKFCRIANEMKKSLPHAEWTRVLGVGHTIHVEDCEKFGKIIDGFLSKFEGGSKNDV